MINNNLVIINPKQLILTKTNKLDNYIIDKKENNTYYNKIINIQQNNNIKPYKNKMIELMR